MEVHGRCFIHHLLHLFPFMEVKQKEYIYGGLVMIRESRIVVVGAGNVGVTAADTRREGEV